MSHDSFGPAPGPVPTRLSSAHSRLVRELADVAASDPAAFHEMALRTRSLDLLDVLAHRALSGSRALSLLEVGRSITAGLSTAELSAVSPSARWLSELAALSALQVTRTTPDLPAARGLWEWASHLDRSALTQRHWDLRAQVAWRLREAHTDAAHHDVASWVEQPDLLSRPVRLELLADLTNPWLSAADRRSGATISDSHARVAAPEAWRAHCQQIMGPRLAPLHVPAGVGQPFDRLAAPTAVGSIGDRSVAIILTTYQPDQQLLTAVRSLIAQTWQEWTLLIVDDASGDAYDGVLAEAESLDDRIRLMRRTVNGGTYQARNTALREVGHAEFVTFHDSDDWSHPQRLEFTLEPLQADPGLVATTTWAMKATDQLELTRLGYRGTSRIAASVVLRRDPVLTTLGFFDPVRKSADKEFQRRIAVTFPDRTAEVRDPTSVIRRGHESLSSSDHSRGWRHHSRRHYHQAYQPWHRRIRRGDASAYLSDTGGRSFWAPDRWLRSATSGSPEIYDRVIAADFSRSDTVELIDPLLGRAGHRVGLLQLDGPTLLRGPEPPTSSTVVRWVNRGRVEWVYLDDHLEVGQVVVADPTSLHPGADQPATWRVGDLALATPRGEIAVDRRVVEDRAQTVFRAPARWWDATRTPCPSWPSTVSDAAGDDSPTPTTERTGPPPTRLTPRPTGPGEPPTVR